MKIANLTGFTIPNATLPLRDLTPGTDFQAALTRAMDGGDEAKLQTVCREFESVFIKEILTRMRATIMKSGLLDGGQREEIFQDMFDDAMAKEMTRGGGIGLAAQLYEQISVNSEQ